MDRQMLFQVVAELSAVLPGARADKVMQTAGGGYCLQLRRGGTRLLLLLSADRSLPRLHLLTRKPAAAAGASGFLLSLRKHLAGGSVRSIGIVNDDRVVSIDLVRSGRTVRLVFELTGASANLILAASDGMILSVLYPRSADRPDQRMLLPGSRYEPPARHDASVPPPRTAGTGTADGNGPFSANAAAESFFARVTGERETALLRRRLESSVARELRKAERRAEALSRDLANSERSDEYQLAGSLILANLTRLRKGQDEAKLDGYDGSTRTVVLDPAKGPAENADAWFRRAKKARAALAVVTERLADARETADLLRLALEDIPRAAGSAELRAVRERLVRLGLLADRQSSHVRVDAPASSFRTVLCGEWEILVGKSAAGNDLITKLARPDDLWLHAEGMPGSHVVVRNPLRGTVPDAVLLRAAGLAAYFSRGRGAAKVPVAYTAARFVKKPKGAKPGLVLLEERRTILARPEPV